MWHWCWWFWPVLFCFNPCCAKPASPASNFDQSIEDQLPPYTILDTPIDTINVNFKQVGKVTIAPRMVHVRIPVPATAIVDVVEKSLQQLQLHMENSANSNNTSEFRKLANWIVKSHYKDLENIIDDFKDHISTLPQQPEFQKRFVEFLESVGSTLTNLGGIGGFISLGTSIMNGYQASSLNDKLDKLQQKTDHLVDIAQLHGEHIQILHEEVTQIEDLETDFIRYNPSKVLAKTLLFKDRALRAMDVFWDVIESAREGKLSTKLLQPKALKAIKQHVDTVANKHNLISPVTVPSDLFNIDVTSLYNPKEFKVIIILHIPMATHNGFMDLYEYMPMPILGNHNFDYSLKPAPKETYLAKKGDKFATFTYEELRKCNKKGNVYNCKDKNEARMDVENHCLPSLYWNKDKGIKQNCHFEIITNTETAYKINTNTWIFNTPHKYMAEVRCTGRKTKAIRLQSTLVLKLKHGCELKTKEILLLATELDIETQIDQQLINWRLDALTLFDEKETEDMHTTLQHLMKAGRQKVRPADFSYLKDMYSNQESFIGLHYVILYSLFGVHFLTCLIWNIINTRTANKAKKTSREVQAISRNQAIVMSKLVDGK